MGIIVDRLLAWEYVKVWGRYREVRFSGDFGRFYIDLYRFNVSLFLRSWVRIFIVVSEGYSVSWVVDFLLYLLLFLGVDLMEGWEVRG